MTQGIDLEAGGRNKKVHRTAPKSENVYLKLLVKVRRCLLPCTSSFLREGVQPRSEYRCGGSSRAPHGQSLLTRCKRCELCSVSSQCAGWGYVAGGWQLRACSVAHTLPSVFACMDAALITRCWPVHAAVQLPGEAHRQQVQQGGAEAPLHVAYQPAAALAVAAGTFHEEQGAHCLKTCK